MFYQENIHLPPMADVTNYYQLDGLKHKFSLSHFWKQEVPNQNHWAEINMTAGHTFSRGSWGETCLASFRFWWLLTFFNLQLRHLSLCHHTAFSSVCVKSLSASLS